jgi:tripartite-type tricarboxylate transporter receptor subunit TctC
VHQPYFIVVNSNSPFQTLDDLVAYAKENPGVTTFGDTGVAVDDDLYIREMMDQLGIEMNLIPYPGDSPLITEILAGELDAGICVITGLKAHVDSGAFRLLAVGSEERHPDYADVPTLKELGVDLVADYFGMLAAPEGTPEEVLDILDEAFGKAINDPRFQQMMNDLNSSGVYWDRHKTKEVMDFTIERDVERATKFGLNM